MTLKAPQRRSAKEHRRRDHGLRLRYYTARWAKMRQLVMARDNHLCQECARQGKVATGNEIDHVKKAADHPELFWCQSNLQTLCRACHQDKTNRGQ